MTSKHIMFLAHRKQCPYKLFATSECLPVLPGRTAHYTPENPREMKGVTKSDTGRNLLNPIIRGIQQSTGFPDAQMGEISHGRAPILSTEKHGEMRHGQARPSREI